MAQEKADNTSYQQSTARSIKRTEIDDVNRNLQCYKLLEQELKNCIARSVEEPQKFDTSTAEHFAWKQCHSIEPIESLQKPPQGQTITKQ